MAGAIVQQDCDSPGILEILPIHDVCDVRLAITIDIADHRTAKRIVDAAAGYAIIGITNVGTMRVAESSLRIIQVNASGVAILVGSDEIGVTVTVQIPHGDAEHACFAPVDFPRAERAMPVTTKNRNCISGLGAKE